jgi:hypothetical protein
MDSGRYELPHDRAPTVSERSSMTARREELIDGLRAAQLEAVKARIAKLFRLTVTAGLDAENTEPLVEDYAKLLCGQPLWAIDAACLAILRSGAKFRPTAPEILDRATREAAPARAELAAIATVLDADIHRVPDPAERDRVLARFKAMISGVGVPPATNSETMPEAALAPAGSN